MKEHKPTILVTGATGLVGRSLVAQLSQRSSHIICLTRNAKQHVSNDTITYLSCDLTEQSDLNKLAETLKDTSIDVAYYLAANIPPLTAKKESLFDAKRTTLDPFLMFLETIGPNIKKIVFAGTIDIYGYPKHFDFDEKTAPAPQTPYAVAKLACEQYLRFYAEHSNMSYVILRFAQIYGLGEPLVRVIPFIVNAALTNTTFTLYGNSKNKRKFLFAQDAAAALQAAASHPSNDIFHIAGSEEISITDIITTVETLTGKSLSINYQDPSAPISHILPSIKKAEKILGYTPAYTFDEGMRIVLRKPHENTDQK